MSKLATDWQKPCKTKRTYQTSDKLDQNIACGMKLCPWHSQAMTAIHVRRIAAALAFALWAHGTAAAADIEAGRRSFAKCASCHQVGPSARGGFAPQLNGIVGRTAAATSDFRYSAAMKNSRIVWTEAKLAAFMRDPGQVVPGTSMRFWGIGDERQVANLLAYMRTLK